MAAQGGYGLQLQIEITSTLTTIVGVKEASFPEQEKIVADVTAHDSPSGYRVWIATGLRSLNEMEATVFWDTSEATHAELVTAFNSDAAVNMAIIDPDGDETIAFAGHITKIGRVSEQEDGYQATITIQPTGVPTIT